MLTTDNTTYIARCQVARSNAVEIVSVVGELAHRGVNPCRLTIMEIEAAINLIHHGADARARHTNVAVARVELDLEFVFVLLRDHNN
jgi:hypothetical protein